MVRAFAIPGHSYHNVRFLIILSVAVLAYFLTVWVSHSTDSVLNHASGAVTLVLALSSTLLGLSQIRRFRSTAAASLRYLTLLICAALLINGIGELIWFAYNILGINVPYPSYADIFYVASYISWILGIGVLFWALDTNIRDELGPFVDILAVTWSLTIVVISLLGVSVETAGNLLKLVLDIVYPFLSALACALLGALVFGPQFRRLAPSWRWFLAFLYLAWLLIFVGDIGFSVTTSLSRDSATFAYLYYDGGPIDFVYALAHLLICWLVAFIPLGDDLLAVPPFSQPDDFDPQEHAKDQAGRSQ